MIGFTSSEMFDTFRLESFVAYAVRERPVPLCGTGGKVLV